MGQKRDSASTSSNTVVLYRSILGSTEQYAKWLSEDVHADIYRFADINSDKLEQYKNIIVSSGTYVGWMPLVNFLTSNWEVLNKKNVVVIAVGLQSFDNPDSMKSFLKIPQEIRDKIKYFKLPGKLMSLNSENVKKVNLEPVKEYLKSY